MSKFYNSIITTKAKYVIPGIILALVIVMLLMGREPYCTCGYIKLWHGVVVSSENSQHLFDWYSLTHISHGLGFFALLSLFTRKVPLYKKIIIVVALESAWEILENTDYVINRYREATISLDYFGDSIINSLGDIIAMLIGFWFANKYSVWLSIGLFVILELILPFAIKDSLLINIIMLIYPIEALKTWQVS